MLSLRLPKFIADRKRPVKRFEPSARNWFQFAIEKKHEADALRKAADQCERGARFAAQQARLRIPWPGETIATLVVIEVMSEEVAVHSESPAPLGSAVAEGGVEPVRAGRCC